MAQKTTFLAEHQTKHLLSSVQGRIIDCLLDGYNGHSIQYLIADANFTQSEVELLIEAQELEDLGYLEITDKYDEEYLSLTILIYPRGEK